MSCRGRWAAGPAGFCVLSASHPSKHMSLSFWLSFKNGKILWKGSTKESWNGNLLSSLVDMKPNKLQYISYGGLHLLAGRHCGFHIKHCFCVIVFWGFMYRFARRNVPCCSTVLQATVLDGSFAILSKWCYVHGGSKLHCSSSMPSAVKLLWFANPCQTRSECCFSWVPKPYTLQEAFANAYIWPSPSQDRKGALVL